MTFLSGLEDFSKSLTGFVGQAQQVRGIFDTFLGGQIGQGQRQGRELARQGSELQQQGFRNAANSAISIANFNNQILQFNSEQRTDALARQIGRVSSSQLAATAGSGLALTSRSFLAVMDSTLDQFSREIRREQASLQNEQSAQLFQAQVTAQGLESRAITTGFRTQAEEVRRPIPRRPSALRRVQTGLTQLSELTSDLGGEN